MRESAHGLIKMTKGNLILCCMLTFCFGMDEGDGFWDDEVINHNNTRCLGYQNWIPSYISHLIDNSLNFK